MEQSQHVCVGSSLGCLFPVRLHSEMKCVKLHLFPKQLHHWKKFYFRDKGMKNRTPNPTCANKNIIILSDIHNMLLSV